MPTPDNRPGAPSNSATAAFQKPETSAPELKDPDIPPAPELKNPDDGSTVELNNPGPPHCRKDTRPGPMVPLPVTGIEVSAPPILTVNSGLEST